MKCTVTGEQMKLIDACAIQELGIPSVVLMERAALAVADKAEEYLRKNGRILCVCGSGNNGADGIAAGRILHCRGYQVQLLLVGNLLRQSQEHGLQLNIAENLNIPVSKWGDWELNFDYDVIIDGIFGIGLSKDVWGEHKEAIEFMNTLTGVSMISIDIPSGIHSDTGEIMGVAVKADVTVTFGYAKTGQLLYPGKQHCKTLHVCDIGFPKTALAKTGWDAVYYDETDISGIPDRPPYSNKGTYGKVLVVAGSTGMSGAAYFSAMAACRMGAGMVKILTVEENRTILQTLLPEAMIEVYTEDLVLHRPEIFNNLIEKQCEWATVIVLGPGLGNRDYVEQVVSMILTHAYVPIVLDADGLNTVANFPYLTGYLTENIIVTPHLGEMARLTGTHVNTLKSRNLSAAREYTALYGVTCVLKDAVTVVTDKDGMSYINTSGCSALAKGGSGDVLSGMIAGLLALGMEEGAAARLAVYLHGRAGERAAAIRGMHGVNAGDLLESVSQQRRYADER